MTKHRDDEMGPTIGYALGRNAASLHPDVSIRRTPDTAAQRAVREAYEEGRAEGSLSAFRAVASVPWYSWPRLIIGLRRSLRGRG